MTPSHEDNGSKEETPDAILDVEALNSSDENGSRGGGAKATSDDPPPAPPLAAAGSKSISPVAPPPSPRAPLPLRFLRAAWSFVLAQWFILGLGLAIGLAAAVPNLGRTGGWIRAEYSIKIPAIVVIFVISGIGLKTKVLVNALADMRVHVPVQAISLAVLPAVGYGIARGLRASGFNRYLTDGVVVMAAMPTTVSTNVVYTARAAGNEAAALVNAVIGNIVGIFITPLWLTLFLKVSGQAPYANVLVELTYTVIAPLILGQLLQYLTPKVVNWVKSKVNTANVSQTCILLLVWATFCNTFADSRSRAAVGDAFATVGVDAAFFLISVAVCFLVAWPPLGGRARRALGLTKPNAVAVVICGSTKTVALGVPLINVMYGRTDFAGLLATPLIIYHALQILLGGMMLEHLRRWCVGEPLWRGRAAAGGAAAARTPSAAEESPEERA